MSNNSFQIQRIAQHASWGCWITYPKADGELYGGYHPARPAAQEVPISAPFPIRAAGESPPQSFKLTFQKYWPNNKGGGSWDHPLTTYILWQDEGDNMTIYFTRNGGEIESVSPENNGQPWDATIQLTINWLGSLKASGGYVIGTVVMDPDPEFSIHSIEMDTNTIPAAGFPVEVSMEDSLTVVLDDGDPFKMESRSLPKLLALEQMKSPGFFPVLLDVQLANHPYTFTRFACFLLLSKGNEQNNATTTFYWYKDGDTINLNQAGRFRYEDLKFGSMRAILGYREEAGLVIEKVAPYVVLDA